MALPPAKAEISAPFPNPSNAVARVGFSKLYDYLVGLLGTTGNAAEARIALGAAALLSPAFTGIPTAPTPAVGTRTTQIMTTAMIGTEFSSGTNWMRLPGGKLIQWGSTAGPVGVFGGLSIGFPISFAAGTAGLIGVVVSNGDASTSTDWVCASGKSTGGFIANFATAAAGGGGVFIGAGNNRRADWFAYGNL